MRFDFSGASTAVLAAARATRYAKRHEPDAPADKLIRPFVTISRQVGAGGRSFALALAARLDALDPGPLPWTCWDHELLDRAAREHSLPRDSLAAIEDHRPTWLDDLCNGIKVDGPVPPSVAYTFKCVASVIRVLAEAGRVVLVGRGSAAITHDLPGGTHIRLVAPLDVRVQRYAAEEHVHDLHTATAKVHEIDRNRQAFHQQHWPSRPLTPEHFSITLNTAAAQMNTLVDCVLPLIHYRRQPAGLTTLHGPELAVH